MVPKNQIVELTGACLVRVGCSFLLVTLGVPSHMLRRDTSKAAYRPPVKEKDVVVAPGGPASKSLSDGEARPEDSDESAALAPQGRSCFPAGSPQPDEEFEMAPLGPPLKPPLGGTSGPISLSGYCGALHRYSAQFGRFLVHRPCRLLLVNSLLFGVVMTINDTYLYLSLERDFKATRTFNGLCTAVSVLSELPLFWYSDTLIQRYGHHRMCSAAMATCILRLLVYSQLGSDRPLSISLILVVQILHGQSRVKLP